VATPKEATKKAQAFLASLRNPADARDYWYAPALKFEPRASSCRSALCELALLTSGDETQRGDSVRRSSSSSRASPGRAPSRRSTRTSSRPTRCRTPTTTTSGTTTSRARWARLPADKRQSLARRQLALLLGQVEADGSFVDAQAQGKSHSTAMAVLTLLEDLRYANR
jgi:hypothetical protein